VDDFDSTSRAAQWSRRLIKWAFISLGSGIFVGMLSGSGMVALIGVFCLFALGAAGLMVHLFGVAQMRMLEFMLLAAVLGNLFGWHYQTVFQGHPVFYIEDVVRFVVLSSGVIIAIVGMTCKGLNVLRVLKITAPWKRLGVVALSILSPAAVLGIPIGGVAGFALVGSKSFLAAGIALAIFTASAVVLFILAQLNYRAAQSIQRAIDQAAAKETVAKRSSS
jgi:hypothetical protein